MKDITSFRELLRVNPEEGWMNLYRLATIVQRKHYANVVGYEDLILEATLAAYEEIIGCDKSKIRNFRSFLYTKMRNTMSNMLYHTNKEITVEGLYLEVEDKPFNEDIEFPYYCIDFVISCLPDEYRKYKHDLEKIIKFIVEGRIAELEAFPRGNLERLLVLVLWEFKREVDRRWI